jgi:hypothetical protein
MYSRLEVYFQAMPGSDYRIAFTVLVIAFVILGFFAHGAFRRYRFVDGTATSKIRSAAMG